MEVELDTELIKWIESKGNQITIKTLDVKACCAPGVQEIVAVPGKPKTLNQFNEIKVDSLSMYVQNTVIKKEKMTLTLSGISFLKSISVKLQ